MFTVMSIILVLHYRLKLYLNAPEASILGVWGRNPQILGVGVAKCNEQEYEMKACSKVVTTKEIE